MMKNQKHKDKICGICKLGIDESKEFAKLTHFKKEGIILTEGYYHISCYRERTLGNQQAIKTQAIALDTLMKARQKLGIDEEITI